jgi:hypothetical protein
MRVVARLLAICVLIALFGACGKAKTPADELRDALHRTQATPHVFVYADKTPGDTTEVKGAVQDDFRYKAQLVVNSAPVLDEVVDDDTVADRFVDPSGVPRLLATRVGQSGVTSPGLGHASAALSALEARQWVVDPTGAPSLVATPSTSRHLGDDPVLDSLTVWRYVENAMLESLPVARFNKEALEYKAKEDPFPQPAKGSGVLRYDLRQVRLPRPQQASGANQAVPGVGNFRKLSVYVKNGMVIQILESIDVVSRLHDLAQIYGVKFPSGKTPIEQAQFAVDIINTIRVGQGNQPIRLRSMSLTVSRIGQPQQIAVPPGGVQASLDVLIDRGKSARLGATVAGGPVAITPSTVPVAATTTTTARP